MGNTSNGIIEATAGYEKWLGGFVRLNEDDLKAKHEAMASDAFPFLRATFYRWIQLWPQVCPDLAGAPVVLAVGDLHVENFGTWRDAEGRLAWGVNDFDEAFPLPFTNDLVRLATSSLLAVEADHLSIAGKDACEAILRGFTQGLESGGKPFVIDEENQWFQPLLERKAKAGDPSNFWSRLRDSLESGDKTPVPAAAAAALTESLPAGSEQVRTAARRAGVGSLGKPRFVGLASWLGGPVAREVKALTPSACVWNAASGNRSPSTSAPETSHIEELVERLTKQGLRCPDPFFRVGSTGWISRRLAWDSRKIELRASADEPDAVRLLEAMGRETANIHLGTSGAVAAVRADLASRGHKWLYSAATAMQNATHQEQKAWAARDSK